MVHMSKVSQGAKVFTLVGLAFATNSDLSFGQENFLRDLGSQSTRASAEPGLSEPQSSSPSAELKKAENDIVSFKPIAAGSEASNTQETSKTTGPFNVEKKGPLVVPSLLVPNISIQGMGTGATPEDAVAGRLPSQISLPYGPERYGYWNLDYKTWTAPVYCHQPVYFEDTMLEHHGHERFKCIQPLVSGARFYSSAIFLPYLSYLNPPLQEHTSAGGYGPGSAAPCLRQRAPYDKGALRFQLLTTGTAILAGQP